MTNRNTPINKNTDRHTQPLITADEAAVIIGVHPRTVTRWARRGVVPAFAVGRGFRFDIEEVLESLRTRAA